MTAAQQLRQQGMQQEKLAIAKMMLDAHGFDPYLASSLPNQRFIRPNTRSIL